MPPDRTPLQAEREKQRSTVRALHLGALEEAGRARADALREADEQLDRVARLLPDALAGGLSLAEIARVTGVSRPTLYELRARYSDSDRDLNLAVLQSLAVRGPQASSELVENIGGPKRAEVRSLLDNFAAQDMVHVDVDVDEGDVIYFLTSKGEAVLEHWVFEANEEAEASRS